MDSGATLERGVAYLFVGSPGGSATSPTVTVNNPDNQGGHFGSDVGACGDTNGDGYADVIIGAPYQDAPESAEGNVFVYHGATTSIPTSPSRTLDNPDNQTLAYFGLSVD
jgi:hypothetical protein